MIKLHWLDGFAILVYLLVLWIIGFIRSEHSADNEKNYILAGRRLSLPGFVMTLVSTWYGGILGVGENTFLYGIQTWVIFGLPYYIFAILFALFLAPKIRQANLISIPDHFEKRYGPSSAIISALLLLVLASPAPYILSIGILLQAFTGLPYNIALILAVIASLIYIWRGGFGAVVRTDMLQFVLMFTGFILLIGFAWKTYGSPIQIWDQLPEAHRSPTGGNSISYIVVWFFIALWTFIDPGFYQRSAAAESESVAKRGILIAVGFWFFFDMLTLFTGFYARILVPDAPPLMVFPLIGEKVLPPFFFGLFLTGLLATIMSTIDSLGLISAVTFGRDILWRIRKSVPKLAELSSVDLTKRGLAVMAFLSLILALSIPSVIGLWYTIGSLIIPGLIIPFLGSFTSIKLTDGKATLSIILPVITSAGWWLLTQWIGAP
ncbi:MAG: hypothetical protein GWO85_00475, partial [Simkaniaceae bacterium]|nr:hypothetical protein [Simkaniaceae bacterium]